MQHAEPQDIGFSAERLKRIDSAMSRYVDDGRIAGIQATVARRGKIAYSKCFGKADIEQAKEMAPDTIFRIYSMSKPITSVAAMMLLEEGGFRLDEPVGRYISWFCDMSVLARADEDGTMELVPASPEMKIWHLFTHTSGLSYGFNENDPVDRHYQKHMRNHVDDDGPMSLKGFVERLATFPLAHQPGTAFRYSFSTDVLGYLVQVVSGMPFEEFLKERVFDPLGMIDTGFYVPEPKWERLAGCYGPKEGGGLSTAPELGRDNFTDSEVMPSGGGGLVSTGTDYLRFAQMLLNRGELDGVRLLGRKTLELMTMDHLGGRLHPFENPASGFGLGFSVLADVAGTREAGSVGSYGWGGAANTTFWVDPVEDLIGLLMLQFIPAGIHSVIPDFRAAVYQALIE